MLKALACCLTLLAIAIGGAADAQPSANGTHSTDQHDVTLSGSDYEENRRRHGQASQAGRFVGASLAYRTGNSAAQALVTILFQATLSRLAWADAGFSLVRGGGSTPTTGRGWMSAGGLHDVEYQVASEPRS